MHSVGSLLPTALRNAVSIFKQLGIDVAGMGPAEIKAARNRLLAVCHPDRGGPVELAQEVNAAYELLKDGVPSSTERQNPPYEPSDPAARRRYSSNYDWDWDILKDEPPRSEPTHRTKSWSKRPRTQIPEWAWAGCSGRQPPDAQISRNDFTDLNFFKKSMWELSGKSKREYTVWAYDGASFSHWITVYGSPAIFNYMATAMVEWQRKGAGAHACRGVFTNERGSRALHLIYADGKYYGEAPLKISHNSFNENPQNDHVFTRLTLPMLLDRVKCEECEQPPGV